MDKQKVFNLLMYGKVDTPAVVVLSGGQDSSTCAYLAAHRHNGNIIPISFIYGQAHVNELLSAYAICKDLGVRTTELNLKEIFSHQIGCSLLPDHSGAARTISTRELSDGTKVPTTFVQGRNALFLTIAFTIALAKGATHIYTGVSQADYSGYPDCREDFILRLQRALNAGYCSNVKIETPLMHLSKAETFLLAERLGKLDTIVNHTMTCYRGDETVHAWGKGCGECPSCKLRAHGFYEFMSE